MQNLLLSILAFALGCASTAAPEAKLDHDSGDESCHEVPGDGPYRYDLDEWTSDDGTTFTFRRTFQVCADVSSIAQSDDGRLMAVFQGFVDKSIDSKWDKIAARSSVDGGDTWGNLGFVNFSGLPENSSRPFDPTITWDSVGSRWRMYFSLADNPQGQLNNQTCTHSANSTNGIDFGYEAGTRFCAENKPVIDPAVVFSNGTWHYAAPAGAPADGAHHATSTDGLTFVAGAKIPSDNNHNWTGNWVAVGNVEMRFFGRETFPPDKSSVIWWSSSNDDGVTWTDYVKTNVPAGKDPGAFVSSAGVYTLLVSTDHRE